MTNNERIDIEKLSREKGIASADSSSVDISFITVNYNGYKDTCELIDSLSRSIRSVSYEVIVVDNASTDSTEIQRINARYSWCTCIRSEVNLGFAGGNNLGAKKAKGKYFFFINNDTLVTEDHFAELVATLESSSDNAALSPMLCYLPHDEEDEKLIIQYAGFTPLSRFTLRNASIGRGESVSEIYRQVTETPYLHGAAMMVKSDVYRHIPMPEIYFLYYEELDWSCMLRRAGYKLYYDPRCIVLHKESRTTGDSSPLKIFYMTRNRLLFAHRNLPFTDRIVSLTYLLLLVAFRDTLRYILKLDFNLLRSLWAGIGVYISMSDKK